MIEGTEFNSESLSSFVSIDSTIKVAQAKILEETQHYKKRNDIKKVTV